MIVAHSRFLASDVGALVNLARIFGTNQKYFRNLHRGASGRYCFSHPQPEQLLRIQYKRSRTVVRAATMSALLFGAASPPTSLAASQPTASVGHGRANGNANLLLVHGRVYTGEASPWAQAIAVANNKIVAVGTDADVLRLKSATSRIIDLHGRLLTAGFIDAHVHFTEGGVYLKNVALRDAATMAEVGQRVAQFAEAHPAGDWIQGEGWSYGYPDMPRGEFHKEMLDRVSPTRPVFLNSGMAHAAWVNSAALKRAGITRDTVNPPGGEIVRGADGEPTGWLKEESAIKLIMARIPEPTAADTTAALEAAIHEANRLGITRVDSAGGDFPNLEALAAIRRAGHLTLRVSIADWVNAPGMSAQHLAILQAAHQRHHDALLWCCVAKFIMDGVLESHTAYMPGGYADKPSETGMRFFEPAPYKESVRLLNSHGIQVYTHAIGDGAIKLALDAYEAARPEAQGFGASGGPRNRIEHAEAPDAADIPRFGALDVIASMQPLMIYPRDEWKGMEGQWEGFAGSAFLPRAFAFRSLLDSHATVAFGTDWPIVQLNPLLGIRNAVLRQSLDGKPAGGYVPAQRITVAEALRAYTLGAAYASHAEHQEGSIAVGKLADFAVFSQNFVEGPPEQIAAAHVVMTVVDGKVVFEGK
jgi:predicted amidohydrolase YtcJ